MSPVTALPFAPRTGKVTAVDNRQVYCGCEWFWKYRRCRPVCPRGFSASARCREKAGTNTRSRLQVMRRGADKIVIKRNVNGRLRKPVASEPVRKSLRNAEVTHVVN